MDSTTFSLFRGSAAAGADPGPAIGEPYQGGYFAGYISYNEDGVATHGLIVASRQAEFDEALVPSSQELTTDKADGLANSLLLYDLSSLAAGICLAYKNDGYEDWYLPAKNELEIAYYNLKPSTDANVGTSGINQNSVPRRDSNYTSSDPSQTSVLLFQAGVGDQAFSTNSSTYRYWTSTCPFGNSDAKGIRFTDGRAVDNGNTQVRRCRPFRKFAL